MSDWFRKIRPKPSAAAVSAICEPGSVIVTKALPGVSVVRATSLYQKRWKAMGSVVVPDFEATINKHLLTSMCCLKLLIVSGSVESSTSNSGKPCCLPNVWRNTSGQSEEPPMPQTITCEKSPDALTSAAKLASSSATACI